MQAKETERLLSAAGFQMKLANSPEKLAHLKTLTQYTLVPHEHDGHIRYAYADAKAKRLYLGDQDAYQRYQKLATEKEIATQQRMAADENEDALLNWELWEPSVSLEDP